MDRIRPAVEELLEAEDCDDPVALSQSAVRANVHASVDHLRFGSRILEQLIEKQELRIVGAEYSLGTGAVEFLETA